MGVRIVGGFIWAAYSADKRLYEVIGWEPKPAPLFWLGNLLVG